MCSDGSCGALADLEAVLDRLADEDLKAMFGPQVLERTERLLRAKNRLDAQLAHTVREGELTQAAEHDGKKTMQSWLRGHARYSAAASHRLVATGRALESLPALFLVHLDEELAMSALAGSRVTIGPQGPDVDPARGAEPLPDLDADGDYAWVANRAMDPPDL
jgi:hypothetical protein